MSTFIVNDQYKALEKIGNGSYGVVYVGEDLRNSNSPVAIKRIARASEQERNARLMLREVVILRHLAGSSNVLQVKDVSYEASTDTLYIITELFDTDMHKVLYSQDLSEEHVKWIFFQLMQGLSCVHAAGVLHRDLKPSNVLLNENCELRLCDFGMARVHVAATATSPAANVDVGGMTDYVTTRWYRAPELLMEERNYDTAIDIWSCGCILAELLLQRPLFPGKDHIHQISCIVGLLGLPSADEISHIGSPQARDYVLHMTPTTSSPEIWRSHFPETVSPMALDLVQKMLTFDPRRRLTAEQVLSHDWLASYQLLRSKGLPSKLTIPFDIDSLSAQEAIDKIKSKN
eukprot:PhF_6_TR40557/c0_g1_i1/m.60808/K04371/MAPK1_3; mitogen-activated protein kinase 1/3